MRETRDGLKSLEKTVDMNLRLKMNSMSIQGIIGKTHTKATKIGKVSKVGEKSDN